MTLFKYWKFISFIYHLHLL